MPDANSEFPGEVPAFFRMQLNEYKLGDLADQLMALTRPAIGLTTTPCDEISLAPEATKIGGRPALPEGVEWPTWRGVPLGFVAQIDLSAIAGAPFPMPLPDRGLLSFFYHAEQGTWGFDPDDKGSAVVIFTEDTSGLQLRRSPSDLPSLGNYPCCSVQMGLEFTVPHYETSQIKRLNFTHEQLVAYMDACYQLRECTDRAPHRLLGHPSQFQGDMAEECHLVAHGINCGGPKGYEEAVRRNLTAETSDWNFLFEIGSDENARMTWGDAGSIYFWIRDQDLKERKFENCWLILQSC